MDYDDRADTERNYIAFAQFHNGLRTLLNIDMDEFIKATTGRDIAPSRWEDREAAEMAQVDWAYFCSDPFRWFIKAPTGKAEAIWALVEARQVRP